MPSMIATGVLTSCRVQDRSVSKPATLFRRRSVGDAVQDRRKREMSTVRAGVARLRRFGEQQLRNKSKWLTRHRMPEGLLLRFIDDNNSPARIFLLWIDSVPSAFREVTVLGAPHEYTDICINSVVQLPDYFFLLVPKSSDHFILRSLDPYLFESPRCQLG